jgi:hypothetical protein
VRWQLGARTVGGEAEQRGVSRGDGGYRQELAGGEVTVNSGSRAPRGHEAGHGL